MSCCVCGNIFIPRKGTNRPTTVCCSRRCGAEFFKKSSRVTITCGNCGTKFERRKSDLRHHTRGKYCSLACFYSGRKKEGDARLKKNCPACGKLLFRRARSKYCSRTCARKSDGAYNSAESRKLSNRVRSRICHMVRGHGGSKSASTLDLLGCSIKQLRSHLEANFGRGMNWENYGTYWHIDHREPACRFDLRNPSEQRRCFHFSNLYPLHKLKNLSKGGKIFPTQRELLLTL